jgi:hypothetical protein
VVHCVGSFGVVHRQTQVCKAKGQECYVSDRLVVLRYASNGGRRWRMLGGPWLWGRSAMSRVCRLDDFDEIGGMDSHG